MEFFIQQLVTGLSVGGTYSLVALSFVLIFGVVNVLNIAQATSIMIAPLSYLLLVQTLAIPKLLALLLCFLLSVAFGVLVYWICVKPFLSIHRRSEYLAPFIASFGVLVFSENIIARFLGSDPRAFPSMVSNELWHIGGVALVPIQMISLASVAILVSGLVLLVGKTDFGRAIRAVAENQTVAELQGISADRIIIITIALAAVLGSAAGLLFAAGTNSVSPYMSLEYGMKGLVVMIVGGVASLPGAVAAGLILGVAEALTVGYISSSYRDVITFGMLMAMLLIKPNGLFAPVSRENRA
jgi:branched-chain amino acid transport system permease protein